MICLVSKGYGGRCRRQRHSQPHTKLTTSQTTAVSTGSVARIGVRASYGLPQAVKGNHNYPFSIINCQLFSAVRLRGTDRSPCLLWFAASSQG